MPARIMKEPQTVMGGTKAAWAYCCFMMQAKEWLYLEYSQQTRVKKDSQGDKVSCFCILEFWGIQKKS